MIQGAQEIRDLPVMCNNLYKGCDWLGSVGTLGDHLTSCTFECVSCKYEYVGCDVKTMRKDIEKHKEEDDKQHLHLALQSVAIPTLSYGESMVIKMTEYSVKKRNNEMFFSDSFYTHSNGYKMRLKVYANGNGSSKGTHLSIFSHLLKSPHDKNLQWPFLGTVSFEILNQVGNYNHYRKDLHYEDNEQALPGSGGWSLEQCIPHSILSQQSVNKTQFIKNDSLYFRFAVKVNPLLPWLDCGGEKHSVLTGLCEGVLDKEPLVFNLHRYASMKCNDSIFESPSFFTSRGGYRMSIRVHSNGNTTGEGTRTRRPL